MTHDPPLTTLGDGRGMLGLGVAERRALVLLMRRYYHWLNSGRKIDPWASGVGQGIKYDRPIVQHGPPPGGYGPGTASPPEPQDALLVRVDEIVTALPAHQRAMLRLRYADRQTYDQLAEAMHAGVDWVKDEWRRLTTRLYYTIYG